MFNVKHVVTLKDGEAIILYGADYLGDKKMFAVHQNNLLDDLIKKVEQEMLPISITDEEIAETEIIYSQPQFQHWLKKDYLKKVT